MVKLHVLYCEVRNPWPVIALASCLALTVGTVALSVRSRSPLQVTETDGERHFIVRRFGLFPVVKGQSVAGLDVTSKVKKELTRLGLGIPSSGRTVLTHVEHSFREGSETYHLSGPFLGSPKDAHRAFAAWFGKGGRLSSPKLEQVQGTCKDRRTTMLFQAHPDGNGGTYVNIALAKPWIGELPLPPR